MIALVMVVEVLGAGQAIRKLSHGRKQPNGSPGTSSDGEVRSGTTTGRCKSPALLVLTLRGRPVRVAFEL